MDNPEKLEYKVQKAKKNKAKTQSNMCWTVLCANTNK